MSGDQGVSSLSGFAGRMTAVWTSIGALPAEILLHGQFGRRYLGFEAWLAMFQMLLVAMLFGTLAENGSRDMYPYYSPGPLFLYLCVYFVAFVGARIALTVQERRGAIEHSRYNGWPRFLPPRLARFERVFKIFVEPSAVLYIAVKLGALNLPLGLYLGFNALCMGWSNLVNVRFERQRALDLRDAMLEQRGTAHNLRGFINR